jgi:5-methylcytosine-specific restriction endonuclease McrA
MSRAQRRRRAKKRGKEEPVGKTAVFPDDGLCPLCGRVLVAGPSLNEHHLVPKSQGGTVRHVIHRICHAKIHSVFDEKELARSYDTFAKLKAHREIAKFVAWVRKQPPEATARHRRWSEKKRR